MHPTDFMSLPPEAVPTIYSLSANRYRKSVTYMRHLFHLLTAALRSPAPLTARGLVREGGLYDTLDRKMLPTMMDDLVRGGLLVSERSRNGRHTVYVLTPQGRETWDRLNAWVQTEEEAVRHLQHSIPALYAP